MRYFDYRNQNNVTDIIYYINQLKKELTQLIEDRVNSDTIDEFLSDYIAFGENDIKDNNFGLYEKYKEVLIDIKNKMNAKHL